jgi:ParB/RepB/Spo0J family partition protein
MSSDQFPTTTDERGDSRVEEEVSLRETPSDIDDQADASSTGIASVIASSTGGDPSDGESSIPLVPGKLCLLDPSLIETGSGPNRSEDAFEGPEFEALVQSITASGRNSEPIKVQALAPAMASGAGGPRYRLISGERRLRACRLAGVPVLSIVCQPQEPVEAGIERLRENSCRTDPRPIELGRQVKYLLDTYPNLSLTSLAQQLGKDKSVLSRAVSVAGLPPEVHAAFTCASDLTYADAETLEKALAQDCEAVLARARAIGASDGPRPYKDVVAQLLSETSHKGVGPGVAPCNTPVKRPLQCSGVPLGQMIVAADGAMTIKLTAKLSADQQGQLQATVENFFCDCVEADRRARRKSRGGKRAVAGDPARDASAEVEP